MWTAQTYLGNYVADAEYFIYLLAENYIPDQGNFQQSVVENLRQLGIRTGKKSAIFVPDNCAKNHIDQELFDLFTAELMRKIAGNTPGLLLTDKNLKVLNPNEDRWVFISLRLLCNTQNTGDFVNFFLHLEKMIIDSNDILQEICGSQRQSIWNNLKNMIVIQPNIQGIGIDFKAAKQNFIIKNKVK